ncbi:uracil-DNA glycosylase [Pedobacter gandavensis]|uniref:uracil-DNA glycosylase n=1 Tax=Pedobacter gandavensis TaxID=2679963 RepID=UPI00292FC73B|nr:uracil-DNA glycosylase [Pedobacter gandavensis]
MPLNLDKSWQNHLEPEFNKAYMKALKTFLLQEKREGHEVFPEQHDLFSALNHTPFDQVKVVILGQDPYHGPGQAHGLSFSVKKGVTVPPSLKNIYKELNTDIEGFKTPDHGNLTQWADQGVLLLNATLTVRARTAGSHQKKGWELFTDKIITELSEKRKGLIFILWGAYAQKKIALIDTAKHTVIGGPHPSPLSAYKGFFGSKPFSKTNAQLIKEGKTPINWQIS